MEKVDDIAALLLQRLGAIDTWRLNKLVYYAQAWHLAFHDESLFSDDVQAWAQSPVVYRLFDQHRGRLWVDRWPTGNPTRLSAQTLQLIDWILAVYGRFSGDELSRMTHAEGPWQVARNGLPDGRRSNEPISREEMRSYYRRLGMSPDEALRNAIAGARLEGHQFGPEATQRLLQVVKGERSPDDAVQEVLDRYRTV
jgi:uncharacterized phage-associated protein